MSSTHLLSILPLTMMPILAESCGPHYHYQHDPEMAEQVVTLAREVGALSGRVHELQRDNKLLVGLCISGVLLFTLAAIGLVLTSQQRQRTVTRIIERPSRREICYVILDPTTGAARKVDPRQLPPRVIRGLLQGPRA